MPYLGRKQKRILSVLEQREWVKGRDLADMIDVPAKIVWPYIERLRDKGYPIAGCPTRGYRMEAR